MPETSEAGNKAVQSHDYLAGFVAGLRFLDHEKRAPHLPSVLESSVGDPAWFRRPLN
jgi:hypothetical protein